MGAWAEIVRKRARERELFFTVIVSRKSWAVQIRLPLEATPHTRKVPTNILRTDDRDGSQRAFTNIPRPVHGRTGTI